MHINITTTYRTVIIICLLITVLINISGGYGHAVSAQAPLRTLYLTFDDGPTTEYMNAEAGPTVELLRVLKQNQVRATFFLPGESVNSWEGPLIARMLEEGHAVGVHSFNHNASLEVAGMSDQGLADEFLSAYWRIHEVLNDFPEAQELFAAQPVLYRRPGGYHSLNRFLSGDANGGLRLSVEGKAVIARTYDYSGWSLQSGDSNRMVYKWFNFGSPLRGVSESDQNQVISTLWGYLTEGKLPNGTQTSTYGLAGFTGSVQESDGLVVLAHDNFLSIVRAWEVMLPRLIDQGYEFAALPRPIDRPGSFIMSMDAHAVYR